MASVIIIIIIASMVIGALYFGTGHEYKGGNDVPGGLSVGCIIGLAVAVIVLILWAIGGGKW